MRPSSQLARDAGLKCAPNGGIVVDRNLTTSDPHIYAAGDAVAKHDAVDGSLVLVPLAQTANLQGRRIADRIMGREIGDRPVLGTASPEPSTFPSTSCASASTRSGSWPGATS